MCGAGGGCFVALRCVPGGNSCAMLSGEGGLYVSFLVIIILHSALFVPLPRTTFYRSGMWFSLLVLPV